MSDNYRKASEMQGVLKLREMMKELPVFITEFFRGMADYTSIGTRVGYAFDLKIFFTYMSEEVAHKNNRDFTLEDLATLKVDDIENFMEYLSYYLKEDTAMQNDAQGKSRKLAAVRSMFKYFYGKGKIPANPAELVGFPKLSKKAIIILEPNEVRKLLDTVESGEKLTEHQQKYHELTKIRDVALITLLLGTGMRVSECVGVNILDINFDTGGVKVTRKGGDEMILYFAREVAEALESYLAVRKSITAKEGHESALFLSLQNRRITERAVQKLVKKYASLITTIKNISPHKLRTTFATHLYDETHDIYLVADILGHADVNTTRKHYAKMDENRRRAAAKSVKLRRD